MISSDKDVYTAIVWHLPHAVTNTINNILQLQPGLSSSFRFPNLLQCLVECVSISLCKKDIALDELATKRKSIYGEYYKYSKKCFFSVFYLVFIFKGIYLIN